MKASAPDDNHDLQELFLAEDATDTLISPTILPDSDGELFSDEDEASAYPLLPQMDEQQYLAGYRHKKISQDISLPLLGSRPAASHRRILYVLTAVFFLSAIGLGLYVLRQRDFSHNQLAATGALKFNAARLSRNVSAAMAGDSTAFAEVRESYRNISDSLAQLGGADDKNLAAIHKNLGSSLAPDVEAFISRQKTLNTLIAAASSVHTDVDAVQDQVDALKNALLQRNAPVSQSMAASDLSMRLERIEKSVHLLSSTTITAPHALQHLSQDLNAIDALFEKLSAHDGTPLLPAEVLMLEKISSAYAPIKNRGRVLLENEHDLRAFQQAHDHIIADVQNAMPSIQALNRQLDKTSENSNPLLVWGPYAGIVLCLLLGMLCTYGIVYVTHSDIRRMQATQRQAEAENSSSQMAILRLMDELGRISEGDLTQEATVTEEITGAIADSVNNTVEEWRKLLGNVQATADKVVQTTADVELTSAVLLEAAAEQLQAIRGTGQSVLEMAKRINAASYQAKDSALVALRARQVAADGHKAVQDSIQGMNVIRDQIQDTAKRIKRLGESSQEIGEITELISDITEQTNVLALNAAIQAASAGEAGRGFSVVAEEVQRLAERSAEATRQIAELVKTIQSDTHDAMAAMERSTQEVVQGAKLSDNAGQTLEEIDHVSHKLSDLIQQISATTSKEANQANTVAGSIQQIFSITEQAVEGTRTTDQAVRELSKVAQELRASIARFKIG
ncbi:MAG: methyl-accepting chemotaxis protein [Brachymonas sp.]|nr:methyl-accepting chemotaxis protein [Brachymonas sp.]